MKALISALPMGRPYQALLFICVTGSQLKVVVGGPLCDLTPPTVLNPTGIDVWGSRGSRVNLNCTIQVHQHKNVSGCEAHVQWSRNGEPLSSLDASTKNSSQWFTDEGQLVVSSILTVSLKESADFGFYSCEIWNRTTTFRIQITFSPSHTGALVASLVLFVVLVLSAVVYTKCRLNFKLWYKNSYGDYEFNDGKLYDAYISYINGENDRKFVNFILKPHLENKYGHKLLLNDTNILPGADPSAELLMNISRCRRLIVVLSQAYLEQEWCTTNFRQGLFHLLELSRKPIFIIFQSQQQDLSVDVIQLLRQHQACITTLIWGAHSMTPSSGFWKELALVMPHKAVFHNELAGDPQTVFQGDTDPMLTTRPDYLDCRPDPDPAGDLGLRMPIYEVMSSRPPIFSTVSDPVVEAKIAEIDVSDLGSRNYAARTDFYCLVTEDDL